MTTFTKKLCIVGVGGFGREVLCCYIDTIDSGNANIHEKVSFMVDDDYLIENTIMGIEVIPKSKFDPLLYDVVVAIGDPLKRKNMVESLPKGTTYTSIIHPSAVISEWVTVGEGSVICAGVILTCNVSIGKHSHLNLQTTVGHDCKIGDYFTAAPSVNISGNCTLGECVYFGSNACIRERVSVCDNVTIGMGSVVIKNISEAGVYLGNPSKRLQK